MNLQWEDTLRWQTEDPEAGEYLDEGTLENLRPDQAASRAWSWLAANGAKVAPTPSPPAPAGADLDTMSEQARAHWLARHLSANGIPGEVVGMGGSAYSVQVPIAVDDMPYQLYLAWEDGVLWQTETPDTAEVLEHGLWWDLAPEESADHVRDWLFSRNAQLAPAPKDFAMPEFYPSMGAAVGAAMAHNINLAHSNRPPTTPRDVPTADPASALRRLAGRLTEDATPAEVEQILNEVLDPEHGVLGALTEVTAAATDWVRARVTFDDPHHNPGFSLWMRLNGCTSMLAEIHHDLRQAPHEAAARPVARSPPTTPSSSSADAAPPASPAASPLNRRCCPPPARWTATTSTSRTRPPPASAPHERPHPPPAPRPTQAAGSTPRRPHRSQGPPAVRRAPADPTPPSQGASEGKPRRRPRH